MKPKAIWLFAGGNMQEPAAKKIIEFGYKLILTDMDKNCVCQKYASEIIPLNTFDIRGNLKAAKDLKKKYDIRATFTEGSDCHEVVATVAKFLNLHGVDLKISHNCRLKPKTREILTRAGIPQPKFKKVKTLAEAKKAIQIVGLPAVLKSTDNSGSRGFSNIERAQDLTQAALDWAIKNGTTGYAILEETLLPLENEIAEQSLETIWYNGKMYWLNWVDRLFRKDFLLFKTLKTENIYSKNIPWSVELAHINPAIHDYKTTKSVQDMVYQIGCALGMNKQKGGHILKVDTMLTKKGPYALEVTLRLSGGWDSSCSTPQRGADFIGGAIKLALGEKLDLDLWENHFRYKNPNLFSSVLALIPENPKDCLGRKFSEGSGFDREESVRNAYHNLLNKKYISQVVNYQRPVN